jgi:hypothetical protein
MNAKQDDDPLVGFRGQTRWSATTHNPKAMIP